MQFDQLPYYEKLHILVTKQRTAYWEARKYRSREAATKAHRLGLEIDKIVREENLKRRSDAEETKVY